MFNHMFNHRYNNQYSNTSKQNNNDIYDNNNLYEYIFINNI